MSIYLILILAVMIGAVILAHHMGVDYGYEHGYNDARHDILCVECRMSEGREILEASNNTNHYEGKYHR